MAADLDQGRLKMSDESCVGTHPIQVIAITSGKGGVGRTSIAVNLALAVAKSGKRVVLFDADLNWPTCMCSSVLFLNSLSLM